MVQFVSFAVEIHQREVVSAVSYPILPTQILIGRFMHTFVSLKLANKINTYGLSIIHAIFLVAINDKSGYWRSDNLDVRFQHCWRELLSSVLSNY